MEEPFCSSDHELLGFTTSAGLTEEKKKPKETSKVHLELLNFTKGEYTKVRMFIKTAFKRAELNHCTQRWDHSRVPYWSDKENVFC